MEKTLRTLSEHRRILAQGRGGSGELEGGQGTLQGREGGGGQDAGAGPVAPGVVRTVGEYWSPWGGGVRVRGRSMGRSGSGNRRVGRRLHLKTPELETGD